MTIELAITTRDTKLTPKSLREQGLLPAVMYGHNEAATPITIDRKIFAQVFRTGGESTVLSLSGVGATKKQALIRAVDFDPVNGLPIHADLYLIEKGQKVTVSVPLEFVGVSAAVKDLGGVLMKVMHELEIEVEPGELPHAIEVDLSALANIDDKITIGDIKLPKSAKATEADEEMIVMVTNPVEEEEVAAPVADLSAIEVEKKGKKEEDAASAE